MNSPRDYNIPHDNWRPGQLEAVKAIQNSDKQVVLVGAPTGSGKTSLGLALGSRRRKVRALTFTRSLQKQYEQEAPGTKSLFGLNAYPCSLLNNAFNADMCAFADNMLKCEHANMHMCEYVNERSECRRSVRQVLSYPYYFKSSWVKQDKHAVDYLYCDEAHSLPQGVMNEMRLDLDPKTISRMRLDPLPIVPVTQVIRRKFVFDWLDKSIAVVQEELKTLGNSQEIRAIRYKKALQNFLSSAQITFVAMDAHEEDFYIKVDDETGVFTLFPLTPSPFFYHLFDTQDQKVVLASATLGNHKEFARLVGLKRDSWDSHVVAPVYPPEAQPVYWYSDGPRMGYKSGIPAVKKQIELIKSNINDFPPDAHVLIHFSSIQTARDYARILTSEYGNRIWMPSVNSSTEEKVAEWENQMKKQPGTICLAWSFHTGLDAPWVSLNIIQKVPYLPLDELNKQLLERNKKLYGWLAAIGMEQGVGRIRRGQPEHYEELGQPERKRVVILDNNFSMVERYFSNFMKSCLVRI